MADSIRVGLVGYGFAGKTFHAPLIAGTPGLELAAISSSDAQKVLADWPGMTVVGEPGQLFSDPSIDLVVIPTPNITHYPLAKQALLAGKHVVVDKPFTVNLQEARELEMLAKQQKRLLSVFHNRRWDSDFLTVKTLLSEGALGDVVQFESHYDRFRLEVRDRWREKVGAGSGIWFDLGSHLLDQALQLFGKPQSLLADLCAMRQNSQTTDYFHAILYYSDKRIILHGSMVTAAETPRYVIHGTKGSYIKHGLDPQEDRLKAGERPPQADWGYDMRDGVLTLVQDDMMAEQSLLTIPGNYPAYYAGIRDAINGDGENPVPASEAITVMELLELGQESSLQQRALPLPA